VNQPFDEAASTPAVKVLGNGTVAVEFYSYPHRHSAPGVFAAVPVIRVSDTSGTSFPNAERRLGPLFNALAAPFAEGFFTGDYEGLAVDVTNTNTLHTFYTATTCSDTSCDAVAGFDSDGNPIASGYPDPTDVFTQSRHVP
jgi:hypothetical protein